MEPINITFLGTSSQVPTKKRNHPALLIDYKDEHILLDCGEGTQRQFSYAEKSTHKITRIFLTHWHGDHILGLPGLLQTLSLGKYTKKLNIYGPKGTSYWFEKLKPFCGTQLINIEIHEISEGIVLDNKEWCINAKNLDHGTPALAYSFIVKEKLRLDRKKLKKLKLPNSPLLGKLQSGQTIVFNGKKIFPKNISYIEPERKLTVILDTKYIESLSNFAKDSSLLITESSFLEEEKDKASEYMHLTAKQAATIAKKAKAQKLALIHLSQRYEFNSQVILKEAKSVFKNTILPNDLDSLVI